MEKRKLQKNEIEELIDQYQNLTGDLNRYARLKWSRNFRKAVPDMRKSAKRQAHFFKVALNATVQTLIYQDALPINIGIAAMFNRFTTFKTKRIVIKYLKNRKKSKPCSE